MLFSDLEKIEVGGGGGEGGNRNPILGPVEVEMSETHPIQESGVRCGVGRSVLCSRHTYRSCQHID